VTPSIGLNECTSSVVVAAGSALFGKDFASCRDVNLEVGVWGCLAIESAAFRCVERHLVRGLVVDTFDNVYLPSRRPVRADRPPCRPNATAMGHRKEVSDVEATGVRLLAADTDRVTVSTDREDRSIINGEDGGIIVLNECKSPGEGIAITEEVDIAVSGIRGGEEIPSIKEVLPLIQINEFKSAANISWLDLASRVTAAKTTVARARKTGKRESEKEERQETVHCCREEDSIKKYKRIDR